MAYWPGMGYVHCYNRREKETNNRMQNNEKTHNSTLFTNLSTSTGSEREYFII